MKTIHKAIFYFKNIFFYILLGIILLIYIFDNTVAIILAGVLFLTYLLSFFITLSSKKRIIRVIQEYPIISDNEIAKKLKRPIESVRNALFSSSKKQKKRSG